MWCFSVLWLCGCWSYWWIWSLEMAGWLCGGIMMALFVTVTAHRPATNPLSVLRLKTLHYLWHGNGAVLIQQVNKKSKVPPECDCRLQEFGIQLDLCQSQRRAAKMAKQQAAIWWTLFGRKSRALNIVTLAVGLYGSGFMCNYITAPLSIPPWLYSSPSYRGVGGLGGSSWLGPLCCFYCWESSAVVKP